MTAAPVYLDYNATAPIRLEVVTAIAAALTATGNPSSVHAAGRAAKHRLEAARAEVAALLGAPSGAIVFTSGGTEANNQVLRGPWSSVLVSAIEHDSVLAPAEAGGKATLVPVLPDGQVDLPALQRLLDVAPRPTLVSVMLANNETGVIQPIGAVAALVGAAGARLHVDAVQALGKIAVNFTSLGADFMTVSAHKIGGPAGIGALAVRPGVDLPAGQLGGGQESGRRAGTENIAGIAGFAAAAEAARRDLDGYRRLGALRDDLEARLHAIAPEAPVYGQAVTRLANTTCIGMPGIAAETQVMALDLAGIAVSAGAACSSGKVRPSHVLTAMGVDPQSAREAIRISLGWNSQVADIDRLVAAWTDLYRRTGRRAAPAA